MLFLQVEVGCALPKKLRGHTFTTFDRPKKDKTFEEKVNRTKVK